MPQNNTPQHADKTTNRCSLNQPLTAATTNSVA